MAEARDPHRGDEHQPAPAEWDASDVARQDAAEDVVHQRPAQPDAAAEKSADRAPDDQAPDARFLPQGRRIALPAERAEAAEPCRPGAAPFAERSCAAPEAVASQQRQARQDAAQPEVRAEPVARQPTLLPRAQVRAAQPPQEARGLPAGAARLSAEQVELQEQRASRPQERRPQALQAAQLELQWAAWQVPPEAASVSPPEARSPAWQPQAEA